jgi:NADH:ubiquinone oxidoreductase subunit 3 (subunit A)
MFDMTQPVGASTVIATIVIILVLSVAGVYAVKKAKQKDTV